MSGEEEELNRVHEDQNWRQRIEAEQQATDDWYEFYGFLAADSDINSAAKESMLNRARRGPLHDFIIKQHAEKHCSGEPAMHLDKKTGDDLRPHMKHGLGWSVARPGLPPWKKYSTPLTTNQTIGWYAAKFGPMDQLRSRTN